MEKPSMMGKIPNRPYPQSSEITVTEVIIDPQIERRIKRKMDFSIIPVLAITYLFKYAAIRRATLIHPYY